MSRRLAAVILGSLFLIGGLLWFRSREERAQGPVHADAPADVAPRPELEPSELVASEEPTETDPEPEESRAAVATPEPVVEAEDERTLVTISARFVDEDGRPLAGIGLSAASIVDSPVALADGTGLAELVLEWEDLRGFFPQPCSFSMSGPGVATRGDRQWFEEPEDRFLGEIPMVPGGNVRGRVVDELGHGVAGAMVRSIHPVLADSPERAEVRVWGGQPTSTWAETESAGSFVIEGLPVAAFSITAQGPGTFYAVSEPVTVVAGETLDIGELVVEPAPADHRIAGVVRQQDGTPVQGAGVRLLDEERDYIRGRTLTDAGGAFGFTVRPGQLYALQVLDYSNNGWPDVNVDAIEPGTTDIEVVFADTHDLRVVVAGPAGRPVRRFIANVTTMDNRVVPGGHETSEDGQPVVLKAPQAEFRVGVHAPGFEYARLGPFEPADVGDELLVKLERTTGIRGRVVADGEPLSGVKVEAHAALDEGRRGLAADVFHVFVHTRGFLGDVTGSEGEFFLNVPQAARFHVHAQAAGYARAESGAIDFDPAGGDAELVLELTAGGTLTGQVLVGPGQEPAGRTIALSRGDGHFETVVTGVEGTYVFQDLRPGPWQIAEVEAREIEHASSGSLGWTSADAKPPWDFEIVAGETTRFDLDVADETTCRFAGRFLVDGEAPIGWRWTVPMIRGLYNESFDAEGRFSFEVDEPGSRLVHLIGPRTPGAACGLRLQVELLPGANEWEGEVRTGSLELAGLEAPALEDVDLGGQVHVAYTLLTDLDDGLTWFASIFASDADPLRLISVPAGRIRVYEGDHTRTIGGAGPEPLLELDLAAGETQTATLGD